VGIGVSEKRSVLLFRAEEISFGRGQIKPMWNTGVDQHGSNGSLGATKKLMITCRTARCHVTEEIYLSARRRENFKPCMRGVH